MSSIPGHVLLWLGFLSGALATVWRVDVQSDNATEVWNTIPWTWYIVSATVCAIGAVILRIVRSSALGSSEKSVAGLAQLKFSLARVIENIRILQGKMGELAPSQISAEIDDTLADDLRIFGEGRQSIVAEYGLQKFADVMGKFAAGERTVNRTWSAAADGYLDEAETCLARALILMQEAAAELEHADCMERAS